MDSTRTTRDIRRQNRAILLSTVFFDGPLSRLELGQRSGLSSATVSTVVAELIDDGLIVEAGQVDSGGGRPRVLLRVRHEYGYFVGVDVGETGVTVELFDLAVQRVARTLRPVPSHRPAPTTVVTEIRTGIAEVLASREPVDDGSRDAGPIDPSLIVGVGVGVPGIVTGRPTPLVSAPTIGWESVPLADMLASDGVAAPVFVGNGANTQAQAEMWFGAARGARHAVVALVGSGVGAAIIADGTPFGGTSGGAGEWGHTAVVYGGRECRCGARGCLEAYAGAEAILERYEALGSRPPLAAAGEDEMAAIAALVAAARADGESAAAGLVSETADLLGASIGNLINLFNPERVVLGGWAGLALASVAMDRIRAAAERQALAQPYEQVTIAPSELGLDAVALGAATLPLAELLRRGEDIRSR
ncbi:MAG TPA: ROK family transcriptional regulator [Micromonosporaceae bacterium]|jgi:predicted NBD/HSP70 family sugar kinase|nr:ROK family transcriptional regulator [Micromonosporaceae bacterium]